MLEINKQLKQTVAEEDEKMERNKEYRATMLLPILTQSTGCSLNIVFFFRILKSIPDSVLFLFSLGASVCTTVHTPGRQKTSAAAELAEFRKITKFLRKKHNI